MTHTQPLTPAPWRRLAAMVYDCLLVAAVSILYGAIMAGLYCLIYGAPDAGERIHWGAAQPLVFVGWIASLCGFFCYFWHTSGQTLGMKTWRLHIVNVDRQLPSYGQCLLRCLLAPLSLLCAGAGYWWLYTNPERQTLHDQLSKTRTWMTEKTR